MKVRIEMKRAMESEDTLSTRYSVTLNNRESKEEARKMRNLCNVKDDRLKYALHRGNLRWSVNPNADLKLSSKKIHCIIQDADVDIHRKCWYIIQRHEERLQGEKQRVASILKRRHKGDIEINENPV